MDEKNLKDSFQESKQKNDEYFAQCIQIIEQNNVDQFLKDVVNLLKNFKNETFVSYASAYILQAIAQAVKQTVQEDGKNS